MKVSLKENFSKEQRDMVIKNAWKTMGLELYDICQSSEKIAPAVKTKLTKLVCKEYARLHIIPFLSTFACGDFELSYDETNAISLADVIAEMDVETYNQLISSIKHQEETKDEEVLST